jgi:hypothetical protein
VIEAATIGHAIEMASKTPCAVVDRAVGAWPLDRCRTSIVANHIARFGGYGPPDAVVSSVALVAGCRARANGAKSRPCILVLC